MRTRLNGHSANGKVTKISRKQCERELLEQEPVDAIVVEIHSLKPSIALFKVQGDSMSPTLEQGGTVGIDTNDRVPVTGLMYAISFGNLPPEIRRVAVSYDSKGDKRITAIPDNSRYSKFVVPNDSYIIGRVVWGFQELQ